VPAELLQLPGPLEEAALGGRRLGWRGRRHASASIVPRRFGGFKRARRALPGTRVLPRVPTRPLLRRQPTAENVTCV
jgi:hypothetical protein